MRWLNAWLQSHGLVAIMLAVLAVLVTISTMMVGGMFLFGAR